MNANIDYYHNLYNMTYKDAINHLLEKYGSVTDDYFNKKSYQRFLKGEINFPSRGKYSKSNDGLECHHINEDNFILMSSIEYLTYLRTKITDTEDYDDFFSYKEAIDFKHHRKEELVYCDLIEHGILHKLILEENHHSEYNGGWELLKKKIIQWFIDDFEPKPKWMKISKERIILNKAQIRNLLLSMDVQYSELMDYEYRDLLFKQKFQDFENKEKERRELAFFNLHNCKNREEYNQKLENEKISKKIELTRIFYKKYPQFKNLNIVPDITRNKILTILYEYKYKKNYKNKKEFISAKLSTIRDDLLDELYELIKDFTTLE